MIVVKVLLVTIVIAYLFKNNNKNHYASRRRYTNFGDFNVIVILENLYSDSLFRMRMWWKLKRCGNDGTLRYTPPAIVLYVCYLSQGGKISGWTVRSETNRAPTSSHVYHFYSQDKLYSFWNLYIYLSPRMPI